MLWEKRLQVTPNLITPGIPRKSDEVALKVIIIDYTRVVKIETIFTYTISNL